MHCINNVIFVKFTFIFSLLSMFRQIILCYLFATSLHYWHQCCNEALKIFEASKILGRRLQRFFGKI